MLDIILSGLVLVVSAALLIAYWRCVRPMPLTVRARDRHAWWYLTAFMLITLLWAGYQFLAAVFAVYAR